MLAEAARVLAPGGALFVYSHVRKNAPIAVGLRWINALARQLERVGLIDMRQERLRKSDHLNPLRDIPELEQVARDAGFRIARIRFYTPIVGGFVENILMRVAERAMARRAARRLAGPVSAEDGRSRGDPRGAHLGQASRSRSSPATYAALRALSLGMKLDVLLFGRITSGPFFGLLVKEERRAARRPRSAAWLHAVQSAPRRGFADAHPLLRDRSDRARHGRAARSTCRRWPRGSRRSDTRSTCWCRPAPAASRPGPVHWVADARRRSGARSCAGRARGAVTRLARALAPDAVIERYYNFGGEGVLAGARGRRA